MKKGVKVLITGLVVICIIAYVTATLALQIMAKKEEVSPKA